MQGFIQGADRQQTTLLPECLADWVDEGNSIRAVDVFVDALELRDLGFDGVDPASTGRPGYHPSPMLSQQIREIFAEHTPLIEPLSLDEAYLDVTENLQGIPLARDVALAIRAKIKQETGLNASAGISYNKFLAKLASDHRKPNGQYVITPEMGLAFVEPLPVGKFHGIGPATSAKMNSLGLYTGLDMRNQSLEFMQSTSAKPEITITGSREASITAKSGPTVSGNPSVPKTLSPAISQRSNPCLRNCSR
jgi:impB/mucB/samB family/IMS family HHH motif